MVGNGIRCCFTQPFSPVLNSYFRQTHLANSLPVTDIAVNVLKLFGCQGFALLGKLSPWKPAVAFCATISDFTSESACLFLHFSKVCVYASALPLNLLGVPASRRPVGSRKLELAGGTPAIPGFTRRIPSSAVQLWMMSWIFSGRSLATSVTTSPLNSLAIELRCGAPNISMSTPIVAAMSMMVAAGFSLTV